MDRNQGVANLVGARVRFALRQEPRGVLLPRKSLGLPSHGEAAEGTGQNQLPLLPGEDTAP